MTLAATVANPRDTIAARAMLRGHVQGIGVRPAIANLAARLGLRGSVCNIAGGVAMIVEGDAQNVASFRETLIFAIPAEAVVEDCVWSEVASSGLESFTISQEGGKEELSTHVPRDRVVCGNCLLESIDSRSRRRGYAFTSCTKCGPRYSVIASMPYERAATTMRSFPFCAKCSQEYADPDDRRYHAQTNACPTCGPRVWSRDQHGRRVDDQAAVVSHAVSEIRRGRIVALRGIGGYQLICDATNCDAVRRLRIAKGRPDKPFAVMTSDSIAPGGQTEASPLEIIALTGAENPIVIQSTPQGLTLSPEVSRGLSSVGIMLPTTPLHAILTGECNCPLVVTSGNVDGDPLATDVDEAERSLGQIADLFVHHNRPIAHPVDDSVVRIIAGRPVTIRLARGLAPHPLPITSSTPGLAIGGHQKVAIALSNGLQSVLGPHLGDLETLSMRNRFESHVAEMLDFYGCRPEFIVADQHPDYFTSRWLQRFDVPSIAVGEVGLRCEYADPPLSRHITSCDSSLSEVRQVVRVQHHHAHIAAGIIDQGWRDREVLGVAFDGTGYGSDGTIWGGEFLLSTFRTFRRVGRLRPFALPGGELAIREPWRLALSLLAEVVSPSELDETCHRLLPRDVAWHSTLSWLSHRRLAPVTTSAGRLFDGVAALVLGVHRASFEGQSATHLEDCCDPAESGSYRIPILEGEVLELDWRPAIASVVADLRTGTCPKRISMKFHRGLARGVMMMCERFRDHPVVLGGGVFQNRILVEEIADAISARRLGLPGRIPPNDGGLAAGQLAIAVEVISSLPAR